MSSVSITDVMKPSTSHEVKAVNRGVGSGRGARGLGPPHFLVGVRIIVDPLHFLGQYKCSNF